MTFKLPPLPYALDALAPYISKETLEYHYGKHHQAYINKLNDLIANTRLLGQSIEELVVSAGPGSIFNNAAQCWNHEFYWHCMTPKGDKEPSGSFAHALNETFGSLEKFKELFTNTANSHFGSGWAWLVKTPEGKLEILSTQNAGNPMTMDNKKPLLTCDVWEHAYYIDTRNDRPKYTSNFWHLVNWEFVMKNYD